ERFGAVVGGRDGVALVFQDFDERVLNVVVVLDDEDGAHAVSVRRPLRNLLAWRCSRSGSHFGMPTRKAHAEWKGALRDGAGEIALGSGAYKGPYSFKSRFESGTGTNPEELIGAAHAG